MIDFWIIVWAVGAWLSLCAFECDGSCGIHLNFAWSVIWPVAWVLIVVFLIGDLTARTRAYKRLRRLYSKRS